MPRYTSDTVQIYGLTALPGNTVKMALVQSFSPSDDLATVNAKTIASTPIVAGDFTIRDYGTNEREAVIAAKTLTATASSSPTPDLHVALLSSWHVMAAANESSNQAITSGNTIYIPSWVIRAKQPTRWLHPDIMNNGFIYLRDATKLALIHSYSAGDSLATVNTKILASATMAPADFVLSNAVGPETLYTVAAKSATATASSPVNPVLSVALTDATRVLFVGVENTNQAIVTGNTVAFPSFTVTWKQPI